MFGKRVTRWLPPGQGPRWDVGGRTTQCSYSCRPFAHWDGMSTWHSIWRLTPDVLSTRALNLAAMDMKLVALNWSSRFCHSIWVQRPWQEIKQTTWFELATSLSHCLGLHLYAWWGSLSDVETPPTWEKGSHLLPRTNQAWQFKGWSQIHHSSHCLTRSRILLLYVEGVLKCKAHPGMPEMWQVVHRYTR